MNAKLAITVLGHSCVLIDAPAGDGGRARILLDPGSLTPELQPIDDLDAILVTHAHPDHIDAEQVRRLRAQHQVPVFGDAATAAVLAEGGIDDVTPLAEGQLEVAGVTVQAAGWKHEEIYPGVPLPADLALWIGERVYAPGDAFATPDFPVEILLLPTGAPWMKLSETIDYLRAVAPKIAIPVHDGGLADPHRQMHRALMQKFAPENTTVMQPELGKPIGFD